MIPSATASASYGIQYNLQQFSSAAAKIAGPSTSERSSTDRTATVGIDEIVQLKQAARGVEINAAVVKTAHEVSGYLIDILA